jgi:autotransporter-associated beta strand protein
MNAFGLKTLPLLVAIISWSICAQAMTYNFAGDISEFAASSGITKSGNSRLTVSGNSTFSGTTTICAGTLSFGTKPSLKSAAKS